MSYLYTHWPKDNPLLLRTTLLALTPCPVSESLTLSTPDGIDIDEGLKFSRAQGPMRMDVTSNALRGGSIGAHQGRRSSQVTVPIPLGLILAYGTLLLWL